MEFLFPYAFSAAILGLQVGASPLQSQPLPIVDLGYTLQKASAFNKTGNYYTFSNVRYAAPPLGKLRFSAPQPPLTNRSVQDPGLEERNCPQVIPFWLTQGFEIPQTPAESEDCLYLDVFTPKQSFEKVAKGCAEAPVLVWVHGGGFTLGSKTSNGEPSGLLAQKYAKEKGMIIVALNYRLGAFGLLNGPEYKKETGTANVGILDQRVALDWVKSNIHKFGGSNKHITLMGESGGAQSIVYHLTADEKRFGKLAVERAILQSVAGFPETPSQKQDDTFRAFKFALNATTLDDIRRLDTKNVQFANRQLILNSAFGDFTVRFESTTDGYIRKSVAQSILTLSNEPNLPLMVGQNSNEGAIFINPASNLSFPSYASTLIPLASNAWITRVSNLYPASSPTTSESEFSRKSLFAADLLFNCNGYAAIKSSSQAKPRTKSYGYLFDVPPAFHTFDLSYTWFNGSTEPLHQAGVKGNASVATSMQGHFTDFAVTGTVGGPVYGEGRGIRRFAGDGEIVVRDPSASERCEYLIGLSGL